MWGEILSADKEKLKFREHLQFRIENEVLGYEDLHSCDGKHFQFEIPSIKNSTFPRRKIGS